MPIDLGGTRQSGIAASAYHQLKQRLGIATPTRVYDVYQMLAEVECPVMERFGADVIGLNRLAVAFGIVNTDWKPWRLFDATPVEVPGGFRPVTEENGDLVLLRDGVVIARMPKDGYYFDRQYITLRNARASDSRSSETRPCVSSGRRLRVRTGPQHSGEGAAGKCDRNVRCGGMKSPSATHVAAMKFTSVTRRLVSLHDFARSQTDQTGDRFDGLHQARIG